VFVLVFFDGDELVNTTERLILTTCNQISANAKNQTVNHRFGGNRRDINPTCRLISRW